MLGCGALMALVAGSCGRLVAVVVSPSWTARRTCRAPPGGVRPRAAVSATMLSEMRLRGRGRQHQSPCHAGRRPVADRDADRPILVVACGAQHGLRRRRKVARLLRCDRVRHRCPCLLDGFRRVAGSADSREDAGKHERHRRRERDPQLERSSTAAAVDPAQDRRPPRAALDPGRERALLRMLQVPHGSPLLERRLFLVVPAKHGP